MPTSRYVEAARDSIPIDHPGVTLTPEGITLINGIPVWERQPWETGKAYEAFKQYFLTQTGSRSLKEAYKVYLTSIGQAYKGKVANLWEKWYYGQDRNGIKIAGALTWGQRGSAYDRYTFIQAGLRRANRLADLQDRWYDIVDEAAVKLLDAVRTYEPLAEELKIAQIAAAARTLFDLTTLLTVGHAPIQPVQLLGSEDTLATVDGLPMSAKQRLDAVAAILTQAKQRNEAAGVNGNEVC